MVWSVSVLEDQREKTSKMIQPFSVQAGTEGAKDLLMITQLVGDTIGQESWFLGSQRGDCKCRGNL